ncbi:putative CP4-6 prophage protein DNA repair protein [Escherichia coli DEC10A]|nr:putative CP4-6 prophage protein DNA repair protein [Escherichia coli DEC10A]
MQQLSFLPGEMTPGERSLIQRALKTLDRHLHEPGVAFTSTRASTGMADSEHGGTGSVKNSGCCI